MRALLVAVALIGSALLTPGLAQAAGACDCDHVIDVATPTANGVELGVAPGDSVCVRGGAREFLRLYEFTGAPEQWITVRNCEGVVEIDNDDRGYGLTMDGSRYVHITGTGDTDFDYGFRVRAAKDGPDYSASGVAVGGLSSDYELDHFEVYETGFAGFSLKTESTCDGSANLGNFIQYDTRLHHNWIHDTRGEGIYFGSTGYGGREFQCDGQPVVLYPHEHHGVQIHHNLIENTGWDGMQVGVSPVDCRVWANYIHDVGLEGELYQQQGMQIGGGSQCEIWGNRLERGPTNGIFILQAASTYVHDNLVVDFGESGIYSNSNDDFDGSSYVFVHNTVLRSTGWGIAIFGANLAGNLAWNNLVLESGNGNIAPGGDVDWDDQNNIVDISVAEAGFVDAAAGDFHLLETSVAVGAGRAAGEWSTQDIESVPRDPATPDVGAYEYTDEPPPGDGDGDGDGDDAGWTAGEDTGDGGSAEGGGDSGTSETGGEAGADAGSADGGCGCSSKGDPLDPIGGAALTLGLLALLGATRPRREGVGGSAGCGRSMDRNV
jgi:MYXO-CTERM domain-containing protein